MLNRNEVHWSRAGLLLSATVVPILLYEDVATAGGWLCTVFGFSERHALLDLGGIVGHAQLNIAHGAVMLSRQGIEFRPPRRDEVTQYVYVHVANVDEH
jgi:uncharacterized glyoxalase superfamily protein PhnB